MKTTAAVAAGTYFVGNHATKTGWATDFQTPVEQPGIAFIGCGIRFHTYHGSQALKFGPCVAVCDVDAVQLGRALQVCVDNHRANKRPLVIKAEENYQAVLDNKDVDVVVVGTVDHWHSKIVIDAMRAGKDVYCEKPVTLTIKEGQQILKVQQETGRTIQVGTQQRTEFGGRFAKAVAMMHDDRVGKSKLTTIAIGGSRTSGVLPECAPPNSLNWELWQGQCPEQPYRAKEEIVDTQGWGAGFPFSRAHRYYRWFYEYSGGKLTDWGAHHVDIAMWAHNKFGKDVGPIIIDPLEFNHPVEFVDGMPTSNDQFNCATSFKVQCTFGDGTIFMIRNTAPDKGMDNGIMFEGEKGRFVVNRGKLVGKPVEDLAKNPLDEKLLDDLYSFDYSAKKEDLKQGGFHMKDFMECCKEKRQPSSDMKTHHQMLNLCHAVNIAMRLGRTLTFDPQTETFGSDDQANSFIAREQRKGYEIGV
ncbi:MAG: Gfo/Idh/MocA family oxidoreductase [Planctomycetota bacterium]